MGRGLPQCTPIGSERHVLIWRISQGTFVLKQADHFSLNFLLQSFVADPARARRWKGLRQDSGDPYVFAPNAKAAYESMGIDFREKTIIYSDSLNVEKALDLKTQCEEIGFKGSKEPHQFLSY